MIISGSQWLSVVLSGYQWFSVVLSGYQWLPMVLNGSQWLSGYLHRMHGKGNAYIEYCYAHGRRLVMLNVKTDTTNPCSC